MSTLETLRGKLRSELKIDPNGRIWVDAVLDRALNDAVQQIESDGNYDWYFNEAENSETTVVGQANYTLPTNFVRLDSDPNNSCVKYNDADLTPMDYKVAWRNKFFDTNGTPSIYSIRGNYIYLGLKPNDTKTLKYLYKKKQTEMSAITDDSGIPSEFDTAATKWAAYLCWSTIEGKENKSIAAAQDYQEAIKGLFAQYLGRREQNSYSFKIETC